MATVPPRTNTPADPNRLFGHEEANQPFHVKSAVYNAGTDTITVTVGLGRADFGGGDVVEFAAEDTLDITPVTINTTYFVFLNSDGTLSYSSTSGVEGAGQVRLGDVATGATKDAVTRTDRRGMLPVPAPSPVVPLAYPHAAANDPTAVTPVRINGGTTYQVPAGKVLYVTGLHTVNPGEGINVNGTGPVVENHGNDDNSVNGMPLPLIVEAGDTVGLSVVSSSRSLQGFIVDESADITPVVHSLSATYTVPAGRVFVLLGVTTQSQTIRFDGVDIATGIGDSSTVALAQPIVVEAGVAVTAATPHSSRWVWGYERTL